MTDPLDPSSVRARFEEIKVNNAKLRACAKHRFRLPPIPPNGYPFRMGCVCEVCQGLMAGDKILVYVEGYIAAGGNPTDVVVNWFSNDEPTKEDL